MKSVFLDRDGTINEDKGYFHESEKLKFVKNSIQGIKLLSEKYSIFVITNQSGIGEGIYTEKDYTQVNEKISQELSKQGTEIKKFYHCPHKKEDKCNCRKPNTCMIMNALEDFKIDLDKSWLVGDSTSDIKTAQNIKKIYSGFKSVLVLTGNAGKDKKFNTKPDFVAKDLKEASEIILKTDLSGE